MDHFHTQILFNMIYERMEKNYNSDIGDTIMKQLGAVSVLKKKISIFDELIKIIDIVCNFFGQFR